MMITQQPDWAKLVGEWRRRGRSGLTLPYLCVATGIQPDKLLSEIKEVGAYLSYCSYIHSVLVLYHVPYPKYPTRELSGQYDSIKSWEDRDREFKRILETAPTWPPTKREPRSISSSAKNDILRYLGLESSPNNYNPDLTGKEPVTPGMILSYIYSILLEGKESKSVDRGIYAWRKFSSSEKSFIQKTLGHPPYQVMGVTKEGDIEYDASHWPKGKCKSSSPVLIT